MAEFKRAGIGCPYCGNDLYVDFDICPHCGKEVPTSLLQLIHSMHGTAQKPQSEPSQGHPVIESSEKKSLTHFEDLEEDSKTKIGTFERLYDDYMHRGGRRGFDDTDYAPLVSLLSSVLELELSFAIYDKFYLYWQELQKSHEINLPKNREDCTLGTIKFLLEKAERDKGYNLPKQAQDDWHYAENTFLGPLRRNLKTFVDERNNAAHKYSISKDKFVSFYNLYMEFYNNNMESILALKKRGDSLGYRLFVELRKDFPVF
ncbi:MAG: zinc ribbon domain-containing protein [Paludibacteraceae bacterium]|nr:zinc ribbon domain-containing protein [Paludibacteraceae bacterium]